MEGWLPDPVAVGEDAPVPVITEPVDRASARSLRQAVLDYRGQSVRPSPTLVHVGTPGGRHVRVEVRRDDALDADLRTEVVAALLVRLGENLERPLGPQADHGVEEDGLEKDGLEKDGLEKDGLEKDGPGPACAWLGRPGELDWQDADAAWLSAALAAYAEAGRDLTFVVVGRAGWRDPRSGVGVEWRRLRDRSRRSG